MGDMLAATVIEFRIYGLRGCVVQVATFGAGSVSSSRKVLETATRSKKT